MKRRILLLLMMTPLIAVAAEKQPDCYSSATQGGLNACAADEYSKADAELNVVWKAILARYSDQPVFLARLKTSQQLWLKFRDAEVDALYPLGKSEDPHTQYGSIYPMCVGQAQTKLTQERIKQLKAWLDGSQEGESCAGSIKNSMELK
ncbi:MAG: lysozyme inhibitor LprI family protein [Rhodanobacter sp.]|jgi:uncharacterized protein YecT (DUF1311 family)|nr:lysozyme inhibitor LprI family protein [Rhodanobacter sp.]